MSNIYKAIFAQNSHKICTNRQDAPKIHTPNRLQPKANVWEKIDMQRQKNCQNRVFEKPKAMAFRPHPSITPLTPHIHPSLRPYYRENRLSVRGFSAKEWNIERMAVTIMAAYDLEINGVRGRSAENPPYPPLLAQSFFFLPSSSFTIYVIDVVSMKLRIGVVNISTSAFFLLTKPSLRRRM